ncbi:hypothetical protein OS493_005166 [Desmophyllum pertusum]|uniref:Uncharacterized protein n=1 Tax=Desmophyllum pertusum TaxID=174260 RepID=A0A9W9Z7H6_9CNID|nr:hypothetical protein OS493_005166 [Desmophyllum pertusum]
MELCEIRALETVDHEEHLPVDPPKRDVFREQVAADPDIQELIVVIKQDPSSSIDEVNPTQAQNGSSSHVAPDQDPDPPVPENRESDTPSPTRSVPEGTETDSGTPPRRSSRARHPPAWLDDYDLC